jgi:hypothetical protein
MGYAKKVFYGGINFQKLSSKSEQTFYTYAKITPPYFPFEMQGSFFTFF